MTVAIDVDCSTHAGAGAPSDGPDLSAYTYVPALVCALLSNNTPVTRIVLLTNDDTHAHFEMLRDEHCDVAMLHRPLFEGRPVKDWPALLSRHPTSGAELLAGHLQEKLRIIKELRASVVHVLANPLEAMLVEIPVIISLDQCPPSPPPAHAVIVPSAATKERLCVECGVPREKVFVAPCPREPSSIDPAVADDPKSRKAFAAAVCEAYEHALASFELRNAA